MLTKLQHLRRLCSDVTTAGQPSAANHRAHGPELCCVAGGSQHYQLPATSHLVRFVALVITCFSSQVSYLSLSVLTASSTFPHLCDTTSTFQCKSCHLHLPPEREGFTMDIPVQTKCEADSESERNRKDSETETPGSLGVSNSPTNPTKPADGESEFQVVKRKMKMKKSKALQTSNSDSDSTNTITPSPIPNHSSKLPSSRTAQSSSGIPEVRGGCSLWMSPLQS